MSIREFILQICGVFLSISLSETIEKVITGFSVFTLITGILIFFLSLNFFFAKFKQLNEDTSAITTFGFVINITTLACFAAMPFLINSLIGIMGTQLALRISDILLILYNNQWIYKKISKMERRWLLFDFLYLLIIIAIIILYQIVDFEYADVTFISIYFALAIFEVVFDFSVNAYSYGTRWARVSNPKDENHGE